VTLSGHDPRMETETDLEFYELFANKEELLPPWLRLRSEIASYGDGVKVRRRDRHAEFARRGSEFLIAEPTADETLELGLHNPGLPYDKRFREAVGFGPRRITHRVFLPEDALIDDELHARLHAAYALALEGKPA
jgi:Domain of unknown function (DUF5655)